MPTRCNRGFYCRSYCLLNMFRASLCPSSGAQEYYTSILQTGRITLSSTPDQLLEKTTAQNTIRSNHCIILLSSWWWAYWCPKHVEQAIRSAIKTSVASSWHFISTSYPLSSWSCSHCSAIIISPKRTPSISYSVKADSQISPPNPENLIKWVPGDYLPRRQNSKGAKLWLLSRSSAEVK